MILAYICEQATGDNIEMKDGGCGFFSAGETRAEKNGC